MNADKILTAGLPDELGTFSSWVNPTMTGNSCSSVAIGTTVRRTKTWSAVTRHRFGRLADLSAKQSRVQRLGEFLHASQFDGDKSPAQSGENSPHSKSSWLQRQPR